MATLDKWLDSQGQYTSERKRFTLLLDKYGMKIPIMAGQKPFKLNEIVYLALPPYVFSRYEDRYSPEEAMGRFEVVHIHESMGMIEIERGHRSFILPSFFLSRNKDTARDMYRVHVEMMIQVEKQEIKDKVSGWDRTYSVPGSLLTASETQKNEMFIEQYDKASLRDSREKVQKLGF